MDKNESFYVAVPQICTLFSIPTKHASRDFKALLGKDCSVPKLKTPLHSNPVNAIPLDDFNSLVLELALKGNKDAIEVSRKLMGQSLKQVFSDAFNVKFDKVERKQYQQDNWYDKRDDAKIAHPWFQEACKRHKYPADQVHDMMTLGLFGDTAEMARKKPLVDEALDPVIGLNHQECSVKMALLARAKRLFAGYRKGTWQEKVKRAVTEAQKAS